MPAKILTDFLQKNHIHFTSIPHAPSYTAQEIAAIAHISGKLLAKTVMIKAGDKLLMVVLPATEYINFSHLKTLLNEKNIELAKESEFKSIFPECEVGAMPPFGNLYGVPVIVSNKLVGLPAIAFNSGSHSELIKMSFEDFERLVHPKIAALH